MMCSTKCMHACLSCNVRNSNTTNRLLRARTSASAAVVVDGPFSALESYMTLPVSEYSLLDSSIIRRVSETAFRFQVRLRGGTGVCLCPAPSHVCMFGVSTMRLEQSRENGVNTYCDTVLTRNSMHKIWKKNENQQNGCFLPPEFLFVFSYV